MKHQDHENDSSHPLNLDVAQLEELEKLIDSLKKEIIFPAKKQVEKTTIPTARRQ
ncbi:MAG: hypothetical protein Kow0099_34980 [Candidatus Abyssubacteria bacterium]